MVIMEHPHSAPVAPGGRARRDDDEDSQWGD